MSDRETLASGARLAIIGAGWIGCEVAATARGRGADVTLIEHASVPLERVLGPRVGAFFADLHRGHGVELLADAGVGAIEEGGRAVRPAEAAGIAVDNGITTDERFRTSAPDVYAAVGVASVRHPRYGRHIRVEHWDTAKSHGAAAARAMLGGDEPYEQLPYFFSDQYDLGLEYVGLHSPDDEVTIRGSLADQRFQVFWTGADGTVTAGMHVNDWDAIATIRDVVAGHQAVA